jgi:hypothetical protein
VKFSALGLAALGVAGGFLAASALAAPTPAPPTLNLKVLVIGNGSTDPTTAAWESALTSEGVAYTEVDATGTPGSETVTLPALTTGTVGNFNGVVFADSPSLLAASGLTSLYAYEASYGVRQIDGYAVGPPGNTGLTAVGLTAATSGALDGTTGTLTPAGQTALPGLAGSVPFSTGTFGYPSTVNMGAPFTPWLENSSAQVLAGLYVRPTDGVSELALTFNYNAAQLQWEILAPSLINWVTNNAHLGLERNYVEMDIDDTFTPDDAWDPTTHQNDYTDTDSLRMSPADVVYAAQWSKANNFRMDQLFNGGGSVAAQSGSLIYAGSSSTATSDPLLAQFQATDPSTGKPYAADFGWLSHTYDTPYLDIGCATQNYIEAELNQNTSWAATAPGATPGTGGLGLTESTDTANALGYENPQVFVPGNHSGFADLVPGNPATVDPPDLDPSTASTTGGTLAANSYQYAVTDQFTTGPAVGTNESQAYVTSPIAVTGTTGSVTLNFQAICHAATYNIYREVAGSGVWTYLGQYTPTTTTADPTGGSTTDTTGGGEVQLSYTDTGAAGTAEPLGWVPPTTENAVEGPWEQNPNFIPALQAVGITTVGADASKPYPNPPTATFGTNGILPAGSTYTGTEYPAAATFLDGTAQVAPRHPINIYYNASTEAQEVDEYNTIYGAGHTFADVVNSVVSGMLQIMLNNDPRPTYVHQTNLMGQPPAGPATTGTPPATLDTVGDGLLYSVLNPLLADYHSYFSAATPYEQPTLGAIGTILADQSAWSTAVSAGTVSTTDTGGTITITNNGAASMAVPVTAPTGTVIEPAGTAFGTAYSGALSDWVTLAPGQSEVLQAPAAPHVTTQPTNQSLLAGTTATLTAAAAGNPAATVQWDVSTDNGSTWNPVSGATSTTLTLPSVTGSMNNNEYEAIFTNSAGSATSNAALLAVDHAIPRVTPPTASAITFGQTLASSTLSGGTASVPGTWSFVSPSSVLTAGTDASIPVIFTPTDTSSYDTVPEMVSVTVSKATPYVTSVTKPLTYGQTLGNTQLILSAYAVRGGAQLRGGTVVIQNSTFKPNAGKVTETVSYIPADSLDYNVVTETITVTVNKAHPKLSTTVRTHTPTGGKLISVLLSGLQKGAKETLVVQNSHGRTQTVLHFVAKGASETVTIKLVGSHHGRLAKGNYRLVITQGGTSNTYAGSSSVRKFKIVK